MSAVGEGDQGPVGPADGRLVVLVTGTGRSGTSTIAGVLHHAGVHVPGPYLGANRSNPKGFFENRWAIAFHQAITSEAKINDFDARPGAWARAQRAVTPQRRAELEEFCRTELAEHDQVVVKDPRSVWVQALWSQVVAEQGAQVGFITMLRHPAEVVGSRATYYAGVGAERERRQFETSSVARWVNSSLVSERETRGHRRAFVPYADLLAGWRPVLQGLGRDLGLRLDLDDPARTAAIEEFVDPGLRRHQPTWDELGVPDHLRELAQAVWDELSLLSRRDADPGRARARLDEHAETYRALYQEAADISYDSARLRPNDRITKPGGRRRRGGRQNGPLAVPRRDADLRAD